MHESKLGPTPQSKQICSHLLETPQPAVPQDSLLRDHLFDRTCQNLQGKNKTRLLRDISLLLVPSAENLASYGAGYLEILIESTGERWENSVPVTGRYPQPDFRGWF
ncbi:reverse transcriptase protein [Rutstroemia sp. NJR-2017a WRK4]|nr:reverse transcriptase protein [Rutstroemia sp. NJR-2017a WRK4]